MPKFRDKITPTNFIKYCLTKEEVKYLGSIKYKVKRTENGQHYYVYIKDKEET